jgi:hypothetical protein
VSENLPVLPIKSFIAIAVFAVFRAGGARGSHCALLAARADHPARA